MLEPHLTARTKNRDCEFALESERHAVVSREEFEKIFHLTHSRGIYLMTDEWLPQVPLR